MTKDAGLRIRVERQTRDEFVAICRSENRLASEVLREFMRTYVESRIDARQGNLFRVENQKPL